ncbi:MAG: hypothetical protein ABI614_17295, partial [Planctomycetota bacterium]
MANGLITFDSFPADIGPSSAKLFTVDSEVGQGSVKCFEVGGSCDTTGDNLAWSPDGGRGLVGGNLYIVDSDGSHKRPVRDAEGNQVVGRTPAWVPDGTGAISYAAVTFNGSTYDIYYAPVTYFEDHVEIGTPVNLTNHPNNDFSPSWSPDGSKFVFDTDRSGAGDVYVQSKAAGSVATNVTADRPTCFDARPDWSPTGNKIVFTSS